MRWSVALFALCLPGVALAQQPYALVLEDQVAWGASTTMELAAQGITYDVVNSGTFATTLFDNYTMMFVTSCQTDATYNAFNARAGDIDAFVSRGGFLAIHATTYSCWYGTATVYPQPPGGNYTPTQTFVSTGTALQPGDPLLAGVPANPSGNYLSHGTMSSTGGGSDIILIEGYGDTLYFRRTHGLGNIAVGTLTYEYGYINGQDAGTVLINEVTWGAQVGSACDPLGPDADGDGVSDDCDRCPGADDTQDADGDGAPDACDVCAAGNDFSNADADLFADACDNCPGAANDDQADADGDNRGDACDRCAGFDDFIDADADAIPDQCDNCINDPNFAQNDQDGDLAGDACDICPADFPDDTDGDGRCDSVDRCPGFDDNADTDGDMRPDACDNCLDVDNGNQADEDGDGAGNLCDCEGNDPDIYPGAEEVCDGIDNNCDDEIDNDVVDTQWWQDADGDGYGDASATPMGACEKPSGYVDNDGDCDDSTPAVHQGVAEVCDGIDNDCDGVLDDPTCEEGGGGGGCGCSSSSGSTAPWAMVGLLALAATRRRGARP